MFVVSVVFRSLSFRCVLMDLPHPVCMYVFVCVAQCLRGQLQLHCCAPLSLAFLSELKPSHGISNFCFQSDYGSTARSSPIMIPNMAGYLPDSLMGPQQKTFTHIHNNYRVEGKLHKSIQSCQTKNTSKAFNVPFINCIK